MKLNVKSNKICLSDNALDYYPKVNEIYNIFQSGIYNNVEVVNTQDISISKIGLNIKPSFYLDGNSIFMNLFAIKNGMNFKVGKDNFGFLDYVIIEKKIYYLSGFYYSVQDYLLERKINTENKISYIEYMKFCRFCKENEIVFEEDVSSEIHNKISFDRDLDLKADLYEYQKSGSNWLEFMAQNTCGCILADEMGLGKTIQIIALFGKMRKETVNVHYLVIAPVSLLENWKREIIKFYPKLSVLLHHGSFRTGSYLDLKKYDVIITSYSNLHSDLSMFNMVEWTIVVLDEAQNIKNPYTKRSKAVKKIKRKMGIAVTGTPFENHMTDLWSIIDFAIPEYLGSLTQYEKMFDDSTESAVKIEHMISPIMLRRTVKEVAKDLPERIDIAHPIIMSEEEASYYEQGRKEVSNLEKMKDISITTIQKLRMFCTHPIVYGAEIGSKTVTEISNKYSLLCDLVEEIVSSNEKIIIFTSFNEMCKLMVEDLANRFAIKVNLINGSNPPYERQKIIDEFGATEGSSVLVLNPKAAGVGLNITAANHVIHYNLEWNPAIEDQASARAYRRGQTKTVFIHRLFYTNTVDEVINDRIQFKRKLSEKAVVGNLGSDNDKRDLIKALSLSPVGGTK